MSFKLSFFTVPQFGYVCTRPLCASSLLQVSALGLGFPWYCVSVSPTLFCVVSLLFDVEAVQSALSSSGGVALCVNMDLMCQWDEVSSGSSYTVILDWKSVSVLMLILWRCFPLLAFYFCLCFQHFYYEISYMRFALYLFCVRFTELKFVAWCFHQY